MKMIQTIVVGTKIEKRDVENLQEDDDVFYIEQQKNPSDCKEKGVVEDTDWMNGILLEIQKEDGIFELKVLGQDYKVVTLHSKKIVVNTFQTIKDNLVLSLYEVLWAAGVLLDEKTRKPIVKEKGETYLPGLYYVEGNF